MTDLPPLECLRFFEAAARRESFPRAADELHVTSAAVAYRVKVLEEYLHGALFDRQPRGVRLNTRGKAYLKDVQRVLADIRAVTERHRGRAWSHRVRIVSVEAVAQKWLMPRLVRFKETCPGIAIELETNHRHVDPERLDFDLWIAYAGEAKAPRAAPPRVDSLFEETLFEETLLPVCSPSLLEAHGRPRGPADLRAWPLLYDLGWDTDWSYWFERQGDASPDLSRASGFRLYSMVVDAAVAGMGAAVGRPRLIAAELERGSLVQIFDRQIAAPARCCLITTASSRRNLKVQTFREWILHEAEAEGQ